MGSKMAATLVAGSLFGSALTASGVAPPNVIIGQMRLQDFHMVEVFLAASASSALALYLAKATRIASVSPRTPVSLGWLHRLDGNIIGGLMLGAGMAIAGACPGTVYVQVGLGVPSAMAVLAGSLLGGVAYARYGASLKRSPASTKDAGSTTKDREVHTIYQKLDIKETHAILAYELMCLAVVLLASYLQPGVAKALVHPLVGGMLIGAAQATSLILTGNTLGTSSSFEQVGKVFWRVWDSAFGKRPQGSLLAGTDNVIFVTGIVLGSWALKNTLSIPDLVDVDVSSLRAFVGGFIMVFGARLGGGCTSGHGISGLGMLSYSSLVSVAAMFAGGMAVAHLIY